MLIIYNIIGCIFLGLTAYFLWSIDGWLWLKAIVSFFAGFIFIAAAKSIKEEKHDDDEWLEYFDKIQKEQAYDKSKYASWATDKSKTIWTTKENNDESKRA